MTEAIPTPTTFRRRRSAPATNVVPLRPGDTTDDIVRDIEDRNRRANEQCLDALNEMVDLLEGRHQKRTKDLVPIGMALDLPRLNDWIEIGQRMLAQQGRPRR